MKISDFGFQKSKGEAFCTGLLAQSLSLSPAFSRDFLKLMGFNESFELADVRCEQQLPRSAARPDVWLTLKETSETGDRVHLVLIESKTVSGESGTQLSEYGAYIDELNQDVSAPYETAKLVLLASFNDIPASREPDQRISWNEIVDLMNRLESEEHFEAGFFRQVSHHLRATCTVAPPSGNASDIERMLLRLAADRQWLEIRNTGKQIALYVDESDPWIAERKRPLPRLKQLVICDLAPAKLNGLTEKWVFEWLGDNEETEQLIGDARRHSLNVNLLEESLERLLAATDAARMS
jgi:hypothetical protein